MRVTKANVRRACAVCERTLLQGEVALRFSPDGLEFVDVCPLCQELALDYGWVREGGPVSPTLSSTRARRKYFGPKSALTWGVAIHDGLIYASDLRSGLWIVRPTGPAVSEE